METVETTLSTQHGKFRIICYSSKENTNPDFVLIHGSVENCFNVITRIQSECLTGHVLQSISCDCYEQLQDSLKIITASESGLIIYLRQEGRGIGLESKLKSYILQKQGFDTVEANLKLGYQIDERNYDNAIKILKDLKVESIHLITNNPKKIAYLELHGIKISKVIDIPPHVTDENKRYLKTKIERMGHTFKLEEE